MTQDSRGASDRNDVTVSGEDAATRNTLLERGVLTAAGSVLTMAARTGSGSTPLVSIRVPRLRWDRAMRAARERGETVSAAVNRFLDEYADEAEKPAKRRA